MSWGEVYLTRDGYDKLMADLEYLKNVKRREISKAIGEARDQGDISENAEYDAAKDAQGLCEKRIAELEMKLASARILDDEDIPKDQILIGAKVKLQDVDTNEDVSYTLVASEESDYAQGKISVTSPVGEALLEHRVGDIVEIKVPAGVIKYKVISIER